LLVGQKHNYPWKKTKVLSEGIWYNNAQKKVAIVVISCKGTKKEKAEQ
jgi:hypothetical protein